MTKPILYKANETNFERLGLGVLNDNAEAFTIEKRNGEFYFEMKYPIDGKLFKELKNERIIKADVSMNLKNQRFEIVRITKPSKGLVTVYADHIHYQSEKSQLKPEVPFSGSAHLALNTWRENIVGEHEFTTYSDIDFASSGKWTINRHKSARRALLGTAGSMLDIYGGEYRFDNTHIQLLQARGNDTGSLIAYGKNLTELEQEEQIANTYTSVYPYSVILKEDETEELVTLPEHFIDSEHVDNFARRKILLVDFSDEQIDNVADLRSRAESYIVSNNIGVPSVNLRVKFVDLAKTQDYKHLKAIEQVNLCDWVTIYFEKFDIRRRAKVIMTKWNCNLDRYEEIELGDARAGLAESISTTVDGRLETVINRLNTVQLAADGKTKIFRGTETPVNASDGDVWFKPIAEGGREMHIFDGAEWQLEEYSAGSLTGTINFANLNAINFIADNISGGRMNLANDLSITNGDDLVLYIDPQSGQVVGNFSELQINFKDVATKEDLEEIELQKGDDGKTAYDLAVEEGFEGTLEEWLQSLRGEEGSDGISITGITAEFAVNTSPTTAPTSGWSTTRPNRSANQYMWTRDVVEFSNNTEEIIGTRMITGDKGDAGQDGQDGSDGSDGTNGQDGQDGQSVSNITQQFAVNTSSTSAPSSGSFSNNRPSNWQSGQYIWTRFMIVYVNPSDTRYTTPIVDTSFEVVEELKEIVKVKDTRNSNYAPSHYRDNYADYQVQERKINTVVGVPSENTHGILVTTYSDSRVEQTFSSGGETFTRYGNPSTDIWEDWTSVESEEGAQEKANDSFGNATEYALQVSQNAEANAKNHADALVNPLKEDLDTAKDNLVELEATVQANNSQWLQSFTASGGVNEIMNSVGYAELEFWQGSGNITTVQNAELETYGSGSAFILGSNSTLEQEVLAESGYRTFSVIVEKDSSSSGYIELEHDDGVELISLNSGTEMNFVRFVLTFDMAGTNYTIRLNTDSGSEILFTNIMVNYGAERQRWGFANGEIYGATFRMNRNGFRVYQLDGQQYTAMTPEEFAGYAIVGGVWERTFALNGDTTEMNKARIKHELQIGRAAQIWVESDTSNGIATVRSE